MDIKELKVKAYDLIAEYEKHQAICGQIKKQLDAINTDIFKLEQESSKKDE